MVESTRPVQTRDPFDRFDEAINDPRLYETSRYEQPYELPYERSETLHEERLPHEPVPLFLSELRGRTLSTAFRIRLRERPSKKSAGVAHCDRCRGGVGDRRPACAVFHRLDARRHRQRQGLARRRGARSVRRGGAGASAGFGAAATARRRARIARTRGGPTGPVSGSPHIPHRRSQRPTRWHRHRRHATKLPPPIRARSRARSPCPSRWRAKPPARPPRLCRQSARPTATPRSRSGKAHRSG